MALPSIRREFDAPISSLQWTSAAYTEMVASLRLLSGALTDPFNRTRAFKIGLALFRRDVERELLPAAENYGVGMITWSPLARGLLAGALANEDGGGPAGRRIAP